MHVAADRCWCMIKTYCFIGILNLHTDSPASTFCTGRFP